MSSDVPEPDSPGSDVPSKPAADAPLISAASGSSNDEIQLNLFTQPDPMLSPMSASSDDLARLFANAQADPMLLSTVEKESPKAGRDETALAPSASSEPLSSSELDSVQTIEPLSTFARPTDKSPQGDDEPLDDDDEPLPSRGSSLLILLLASYSSAVTLGLVWVLFSGRRLNDMPPIAPRDFENRGIGNPIAQGNDPGLRAAHSRTVVPPLPIPTGNMTTIGKPLRLGDLEVTPLALSEGRVSLERTLTDRTTKLGGGHALKLRLRLTNTSTATVFAPLDEAFLRQRLRAEPESFIESSTGEQIIELFPLAVESEWSIIGQPFRDLRPGESFESIVVSEANALDRLVPEMVWRIHLRTGIDRTADLGVRFRRDEVYAEPAPSPAVSGDPADAENHSPPR